MSDLVLPKEGRPLVISLCDLTGHAVAPWVDAGYDAVLVDPQHDGIEVIHYESGASVYKLPFTVLEAGHALSHALRWRKVAIVFGWPPCTDMAVSGARWFEAKRAADKMFQAKAVMIAEQCRMVGVLSGAPYLVENPVSVLASAFGKPSHTFNPHDFTALEPADNYRKKTCLWTGNGFQMPPAERDESLGAPDDRIHKAPPGPERANFRSATPMGFARAVFAANHRPALEIAA